ncbi:hypothetical protein GCM10025862_32560 [Arsenicicoccus piscis]|uniref:ABC transporter ATP-binding protein n=1 Tax=Arsenicicoccus piscis TaxID=673954 RepID=A0ABQ6HRZ0_9MICO|nr:hypothetical protein GCM10025862_32560 [Arsenicicoccus piscis]
MLDQLVYLARLKGQPENEARLQATGLLERFALADRGKDKLEKLSLGNQQRVQIAAAVMGQPQLLILDEPFSGLDPVAVEAMADLLREHTAQGIPVLFSSHQLDLIDRLCDGLVILNRGRVVANGSRDELRSTGRALQQVRLDHDAGWLRGTPGVYVADVDGTSAVIELLDDGARRLIVEEAMRRGNLLELKEIRPSLSEIYREVTA